MIKTKIKYEDIQAGDLIEAVTVIHGVRLTCTGIAFEKNTTKQGDSEWLTSEGGAITIEDDGDTIYRIDVSEVTFEGIRTGDLVRVTETMPESKTTVEFIAQALIPSVINPFWSSGDSINVHKYPRVDSVERTIEILERGAGA